MITMFDRIEFQVLGASVTVVGVFLLLRRIKQNGIKDDGKRYPPSMPLLPLFWAILSGGMAALPDYFMRSAEKLGPVFSFTVGGNLIVVLNGYETIFSAFARQSEAFADRVPLWIEENIINHELRGIVFARYNAACKKYHKLSLSILKEFGYGVERVSETRILQEVELLNGEILKQNGRPFNPNSLILFTTSNVLLSILFGKDFIRSLPKDHSAIVKNAAKCASNMDLTLNIAPFLRYLPTSRRKIDNLRTSSERLLNAIDTAITFIKSNKSEATFVGRFLEIEGANYDHQDLIYIMRDMCFAGTDTVPTTLSWALVELANHPEVLTRFQREIDDVVPRDRLPSLDDKPHLPYTEAVMLEVWRRHIIVPFYVPHATTKDVKVLEYDVPKGCMVIANGYSAHMDPKYWKDPEEFRPERFLDKDNKIIDSEKMIVFSLGKRACLGEILGRQKTFLFLTSLVQRFNIRPPEGQDRVIVKEVIATTCYPSPFEVRLIPRM